MDWQKTVLTYMNKKAVLGIMFQTVFTSCLQTLLTYKDKKVPFYRAFRNLFTLYLQHLSSNRTNNRHFLPIRRKILSPSSNSHRKAKNQPPHPECCFYATHLIATENRRPHPHKNISHLYEKNQTFVHPILKIFSSNKNAVCGKNIR